MNQFLKNLSDEQKVDALLCGSEKLTFSPNTKNSKTYNSIS